jgi:uncharacterized protein (TIGR00304 family)
MEEQLIPLGFIVIVIGIVIVFIGSVLTASKSKNVKVDWGVGGFIGPIPFGFGSNQKIVYLIAIISLIIFVLFILFGQKLI